MHHQIDLPHPFPHIRRLLKDVVVPFFATGWNWGGVRNETLPKHTSLLYHHNLPHQVQLAERARNALGGLLSTVQSIDYSKSAKYRLCNPGKWFVLILWACQFVCRRTGHIFQYTISLLPVNVWEHAMVSSPQLDSLIRWGCHHPNDRTWVRQMAQCFSGALYSLGDCAHVEWHGIVRSMLPENVCWANACALPNPR